MSEQTGQSVNDAKESGRRPHHSAWLAHWTRTNRNTAAEAHSNYVSANKELGYASMDDSSMNGMEVPKSAKGVGKIEIKDFSIMNESLGMSSKSLGNVGRVSSLFKHDRDTVDMQALSPIFEHNLDHGKAEFRKRGILFPSVIAKVPSCKGTSSIGCSSLGEGAPLNPLKWMKTQSSAKVSSFAVPKPLHETFVESSTHVVPYKFDFGKYDTDKGKAAVSSSMSRFRTLPKSNFRMMEQEHCHGASHSANLVHERKMVNDSESDASMNVRFREIKSSLLFDAPSTSSNQLQQFDPEWFQKMQECSLILFNSQYIASEKTKLKKSHRGHYSLQKPPDCVTDVETMRICTMMDSVEGTAEGFPKFSQTTHSLLITKKADVDLSKETDTFKSSRFFTNIDGNTSCNLPPFFGQGVRLQALSSSSDLEGTEDVCDVKASKIDLDDESSAETDSINLHFINEKNLHTGTNSATSNKAFNMVSILPPPNISNLDPSAFPAPVSLAENRSNSSSRTQSLEMDVLLANSVEPKRKLNLCLDNSKEADLSSRWVKRLKLSASKSSTQSTESSSKGGNSSNEKLSKYFSRSLKNGIASLEPNPRKHHDKGSKRSNKSGELSMEDEDLTSNSMKKGELLSHSHAWIQRWLSNETRTAQNKPETVSACQPQSSKVAPEDIKSKHFPSIGAMALMGKAMSSFHQCEIQKRGSFTFWKTKTFSKQ